MKAPSPLLSLLRRIPPGPEDTLAQRSWSWWGVLAIVWVAAAAYVAPRMDHGWVAHDEGTLGQTAERVLHGELPHRDFGDPYTGGLALLNAGAFRLLGVNLLSMRVPLFLAFLVWVPVLYYVATRFVGPLAAGLVVSLAASWSLPNYAAPLPSWYNLFFATFGTGAILRFLETERLRWLVVAGACGGLSILFKVVGLFYVAAALMLLVYRERVVARDDGPGVARGDRVYRGAVTVLLVGLVTLLVWLVRARLSSRVFVHFVLPTAALVWVLVRAEWGGRSAGPTGGRVLRLARLLVPFAAGVALPLAVFAVPYVLSGAMDALLHGVLVAPMRRTQFAAMPLPRPETWVVVPFVLLLLGVVPRWEAWLRGWRAAVVGLVFVAAVALANNGAVYSRIFNSMRALVPTVVVWGAWVLHRGGSNMDQLRRQQLFLLLATAALCSVVQFPFSAPIYFFYVAPLAALAGLALVSSLQPRPQAGPVLLGSFYLLFAIARVHPGFLTGMGFYWHHTDQTERLALERGGVLINPDLAQEYVRVVAVLRRHARGEYVYAGPDCPEVYFLAGRRNPTRTIFEFLEDTTNQVERTVTALETRGVTAIAINNDPDFSGPLPPGLRAALVERYPQSDSTGTFVVRWKP